LVIEHWTLLSYILNAVRYTLFSNVLPFEGANMKLVGLVILGLVSSFAAGMLLLFLFSLILKATGNADSGNIGEGAGMLLVVFAVMPIAFFLGSMITGYFSFYEIEDKWLLLWMAPVLYLELAWLCVSVVIFLLDRFIDVNPPGQYFLQSILISIGIGLYWYAASAGGVFLGYYIRDRFVKWWYGD
jgi:hypothetical protein